MRDTDLPGNTSLIVAVQVETDRLSAPVRLPDMVLFGEATLGALELEKLAEAASELYALAADMKVTFRVAVTLEGRTTGSETIEKINQLLGSIQKGWKVTGG